MDPLNNCSHDNKHNILILLVAALVILQAVNCVFSYKTKENSYIIASHDLGYINSINPNIMPLKPTDVKPVR